MKNATAAAAKKAIVAKRAAPSFEGVPGELISEAGLDLNFNRWSRSSPYDPLLDQLAAAPKGQLLRFGDLRAKPSIYSRAKKKGILVAFAEAGGALYVKFMGRVDDNVRETRRTKIIAILKQLGAMSYIRIANKLREGGDDLVDAPLVESILLQMAKTGEVIRQENSDWRLNPTFKGAK